MRLRVYRTGVWAVLMDDQPPPAPNWFVLNFGRSNPWATGAEVLGDDWQEAVVLVPGLEAGARLVAALMAAHEVNEIDVPNPVAVVDALCRLAEEAGRD